MKRLETITVLSRILQKKERLLQTLEDSIRVLRAAIIEVELAEEETVTTPQKGTVKEQTAEAIYDVLQKAQIPLHRKVILTKVKERGLIIGGGISTIGGYLSMDDRFKNVGKGIWTLAEEPQAEKSITGSIPDIPSLNIPDLVLVPNIGESQDDDLPF